MRAEIICARSDHIKTLSFYEFRETPRQFSFAHDRTKGLYVVTKPDGTTEMFRDNPMRYLVVEPDPQTGELRRQSNTAGRCISTCAASSERAEDGFLSEMAVPMGKYSETLTEHVMAPRNGGSIENPDLTGHAGSPGRGAFMILYLKIEDDRIAAAKYHTVGCGPTIASGSMLTEMIRGKSIAECRELTVENLIEALDGVPPDKLHCPALAIGALKDALAHWPGPQKEPA